MSSCQHHSFKTSGRGRGGYSGRGRHFAPPPPTYLPQHQQRDWENAVTVSSALMKLFDEMHESSSKFKIGLIQKSVVIMRGIPGCGKSTFVEELKAPFGERVVVVSADDYFMKDGEYKFDPTKIRDAHTQCQEKFDAAMKNDAVELIIVDNTNITARDMAHYTTYEIRTFTNLVFVRFVVTDDNLEFFHARNTHGVPLEVCQRRLGLTHRVQDEFLVRPDHESLI